MTTLRHLSGKKAFWISDNLKTIRTFKALTKWNFSFSASEAHVLQRLVKPNVMYTLNKYYNCEKRNSATPAKNSAGASPWCESTRPHTNDTTQPKNTSFKLGSVSCEKRHSATPAKNSAGASQWCESTRQHTNTTTQPKTSFVLGPVFNVQKTRNHKKI